MKSLIKPMIILSFLLILTGIVPTISLAIPILGLLSMAGWMAVGVLVLGSEDRNYEAQLSLIRLEHVKAQELLSAHAKKYEELANLISKAISENRSIQGQLR